MHNVGQIEHQRLWRVGARAHRHQRQHDRDDGERGEDEEMAAAHTVSLRGVYGALWGWRPRQMLPEPI